MRRLLILVALAAVVSSACGGGFSTPTAQFVASDLFARTSDEGTPLTLVLNLAPDFRHNEFQLELEQNLPIAVLSLTARTLIGSTLSIADLHRVSVHHGVPGAQP